MSGVNSEEENLFFFALEIRWFSVLDGYCMELWISTFHGSGILQHFNSSYYERDTSFEN
jgi:hypothetical protein